MVDWQLEEQLLSWLQKLASQLRQLREQQPLSCGVKDEWELCYELCWPYQIYTYLNRYRQTEVTFTQPFDQYGGHIEFIRFKKYYGMLRGHSLSICAPFSDLKRTSLYISGEQKGNHYYIQTRHNDLFFPLKIFLMGKLKEKLAEKRASILSECIGSCSCPFGIP